MVDNGYWTQADRNRLTNWWKQYGVTGRYEVATGRYFYYTYPGGVETQNLDHTVSLPGESIRGGADLATEAVAGVAIPGPALP
jgi:hypothetical protein